MRHDDLRNPAPGVHLISSSFKETPAQIGSSVLELMEHRKQTIAEQRAADIVDEIVKLTIFLTDKDSTAQQVRQSRMRLFDMIVQLIL